MNLRGLKTQLNKFTIYKWIQTVIACHRGKNQVELTGKVGEPSWEIGGRGGRNRQWNVRCLFHCYRRGPNFLNVEKPFNLNNDCSNAIINISTEKHYIHKLINYNNIRWFHSVEP